MDKKFILTALFLLAAAVISFLTYQSQELKRIYMAEVKKGTKRTSQQRNSILTESDILHLPEPVRKYLRYVGVIGKEKVFSVKAVCEGEMKLDPKKGWVKINSEQYNFFDDHPTRLFYMKALMFGLPVLGLHSYTDEAAYMHIKVAGLFTVLDSRGPEMRIGDTTTLFNDMCFFAPATLIDHRIQWEAVDPLTVKATFTNQGTTISAVLYFNEKGELVNFISNDRFYIPMDGSSQKAVWSTPISNYKDIGGLKLPSYGEAVWKLPEGDYCYAKFTNIKEVKYNSEGF
ncbi:MAG: hypothetical protein N2484_06750 [Clostridia bacterium]|nr:hypothetical protein [Clostridia bacterium]